MNPRIFKLILFVAWPAIAAMLLIGVAGMLIAAWPVIPFMEVKND